MAPALSNLVILTPRARKIPLGVQVKKEKNVKRRASEEVARFVRARHPNEHLPMRFHVELDVNVIDGDRMMTILKGKFILRNICFEILATLII